MAAKCGDGLRHAEPASGGYRGRFAPSPTGPLHAGSLVAALASWLDARAHGGQWLVRIEDVDLPRCPSGMGEAILQQLSLCGLIPDEVPWWQSRRSAEYVAARDKLLADGRAYACGCTRSEIEAVLAARGVVAAHGQEMVYPGTCRTGLHGKPPRATRFRAAGGLTRWVDRRLGPQAQDVAVEVGDFILHRADGLAAYQLAVVVDDGAQGITHIVRGADLADNTPRQIQLLSALGLPCPRYLHTPLVMAPDRHKLSKQNGAQALDLNVPLRALQSAAGVLGLPWLPAIGLADWLQQAVAAWAGIIAVFEQQRTNS
jgi:glutamyl-Q tRNA(Asp) synthetase